MDKIIYIAGPMTGLPQYNRPAFAEAERVLDRKFPEAVIINPAMNFGGDLKLPYAVYMRMSIHQLLMATAVCLLAGWQGSSGAVTEKQIADSLDLRLMHLHTDGRLFEEYGQEGEDGIIRKGYLKEL